MRSSARRWVVAFATLLAFALPLTASASVSDAVSSFTYTQNMHPMGFSERAELFPHLCDVTSRSPGQTVELRIGAGGQAKGKLSSAGVAVATRPKVTADAISLRTALNRRAMHPLYRLGCPLASTRPAAMRSR